MASPRIIRPDITDESGLTSGSDAGPYPPPSDEQAQKAERMAGEPGVGGAGGGVLGVRGMLAKMLLAFDPKAYADAVEAHGSFDPRAYAEAVEANPAPKSSGKRAAIGRVGAQEMADAQAEQPTLGAAATGAAHFARQVSFGLGDKILAGEQALGDWAHDKTGKVTLGDAYRRDLAFNDKLLEHSDEEHPIARWAGNAAGFAGNLAGLAIGAPARVAGAIAPTLAQLAGQGAKIGAMLGGVGGFGADRSESTLGTLANTGLGAGLGAATSAITPYASSLLGRGAQFLGGKAQDLAGILKVNSIHPTPTVAEKMADLPGGEAGVGKALLQRWLGGVTKKGTAAQIEEATKVAGKDITALATAHDAAGGPPVVLDTALQAGRKAAQALQAEPTTEAAGNRLEEMVTKYEAKFLGKPVPAAEALALKRALGKAAYGAGQQFQKSGDTISGDFGAGLSKFERAVDDTLDQHLGPEFGQANLAFRQLLGAGQAAARSAARTQGNAHPIGGLIPAIVGGGVMAAGHGGPEALAYGLGSSALQKYGGQLGARALYSPVAGTLGLLGRGLQAMPPAALGGVVGQRSVPYGASLMDLLGPNAGGDR